MAANASVAVARLGGAASYWGRVGADALGERILGDLAAEGVDVGTVRRVPGRGSPSAAILVLPDGERLVCAYNDPALDPDPGWLPLSRVAGFDAVDLAGRASHTVFSEPGLRLAAGGDLPGKALARIAAEVRGVVGVTLGADGFLWLEGQTERRVAAPGIVAVDTLAAGDVWHGAFALALGEGSPILDAARFANAAAALKCTRPGGRQGAPGRAEVMRLLHGTI